MQVKPWTTVPIFHILLAVYLKCPLGIAAKTYVPVEPIWNMYLNDNVEPLNEIQVEIRALSNHVARRCELNIPGTIPLKLADNREDKRKTVGAYLEVIGTAIYRLTSYADSLKARADERGEPYDTPTLLRVLKPSGFNKIDQIYLMRDILKTQYYDFFMEAAERLLEFRTWTRTLASQKASMNKLLLQIYNGRAIRVSSKGIPGINAAEGTKVVEIDSAARQDFTNKFNAARDLAMAMRARAKEGVQWADLLDLPERTSTLVFGLQPDGTTTQKFQDISKALEDKFSCWYFPIRQMVQALELIPDPPNTNPNHFNLPYEIRPPEGWEWEEGTEDFLGMLKRPHHMETRSRSEFETLGARAHTKAQRRRFKRKAKEDLDKPYEILEPFSESTTVDWEKVVLPPGSEPTSPRGNQTASQTRLAVAPKRKLSEVSGEEDGERSLKRAKSSGSDEEPPELEGESSSSTDSLQDDLAVRLLTKEINAMKRMEESLDRLVRAKKMFEKESERVERLVKKLEKREKKAWKAHAELEAELAVSSKRFARMRELGETVRYFHDGRSKRPQSQDPKGTVPTFAFRDLSYGHLNELYPRASVSVPPYISTKCPKPTDVSSACGCYLTTTVTTTSTTTTTTTTSSSTTTSSTPPACTPSFSLSGASETNFNPIGKPFDIILSCTNLNASSYGVLANGEPVIDTTVSGNVITIPGQEAGTIFVQFGVFAFDDAGNPLFGSFNLLFGSISMPVKILDPSGQPAAGVKVEAASTIYVGVKKSGVTDAAGMVTFINMPSTTISLIARTDTNEIAVSGLAATSATITLTLLPFLPPSPIDNNDFSLGSDGWVASNTGSISVITHTENKKRALDNDLSISTNFQPNLQLISRSYTVKAGTKSVSIRYKFITAEIPGGYFGTQYNDYFSVTIRSDAGDFMDYSNSMNNLGLGAFDANGATDWFTLKLDIRTNAKTVQFDIGVSNVADSALQSQVVIDKIDDTACELCDDCTACPTAPKCQDNCKVPVFGTCDFYTSCAEATFKCGATGYPLDYGARKCADFSVAINNFSPAGQDWIFKTMNCLQKALVPKLTCGETCDSIGEFAFNSHPGCYIEAGVCGLVLTNPKDIGQLIAVVWKDVFSSWKAGVQGIDTVVGCGGKVVDTFTGEIAKLTAEIEDAAIDAAVKLSKIALKAVYNVSLKAFQNAIKNALLPNIS
ncbi:hypothetical protein H072_11086 [Dactylellina haptotyla CBS 200.50]|uniref:Uncharacterized protein n=1 Tax=Dactylellina haptotyla (strain CBS 200.50) TaxID=1284197 RepID=S7ZYG6_DACHA|nr:hypothetical protein H072_11086 [Dactylellina haptotyla CBS 200.50]